MGQITEAAIIDGYSLPGIDHLDFRLSMISLLSSMVKALPFTLI